ncbi:MAG: flagellar hook-basal body complex protein [Planctomycetes bacterium]|nr:flagellar hook-basal body complex protein [Planctomycetota bacterium]
MSLLRSMSAGISGVRAQQTKIDVLGHNIANATTVGYKAGRVDFSALLSQTLRFGQGANGESGGVNPQQVGLGVQVGGIQYDFSDGARRATGIATDLALEGSGFFILRDLRTGGLAYTRDGSFSLNALGELIDPALGLKVQGYLADRDPSREITLAGGGSDFVINNTGQTVQAIDIPLGELRIARQTGGVTFAGNLNSGGDLADTATVLESDVLFERVGPLLIPATESSLLENIVRTSDGTAGGTIIDLGMDVGADVTVTAQVGGRLVDRTFTVGQPQPNGGTTLGQLRDFLRGALGILNSGDPGAEAFSSIRNDAVSGEQLAQSLSQLGEAGYATLTLDTLAAGQTIVIGGQTFVAGTDFAVGVDDAETASNFATAINLNNTLAPQLVASVVAPAGGPVQLRMSLRTEGASALAINTAGAAGAIQTTGAVRFGSDTATSLSDGDTITMFDGVTAVTFEFDDNAVVGGGNVVVTLGATATESAENFAAALAASAIGPAFSTAVQGGGLRITDSRVGAAAVDSGTFLSAFTSANAGAITFEENIAGAGQFIGDGASADGFLLGTTPFANGAIPASIRDDEVDFIAAGVQVGDMIRFTTGNVAGTIARVTAVGQRADGTLDRHAITFEWESGADRTPSSSQTLNYFIHEAADVGIGVASLVNPNVPPTGLDPSSPAGTLRVSGNVGFDNRIQGLSVMVKGSEGVQQLAEFTELTAATGESFTTTVAVYDSLGTAHNVNFTFYLEARASDDPAFRYIATSNDQVTAAGTPLDTVLGTGVLRFDTNGQLILFKSDGQTSLQLNDQGAQTPLDFNLDFSTLTAYAAQGTNNVSDVFMQGQDGYAAGTLIDFSITQDGVVQGLFSNGLVRSLAQIAVARFANPNGLMSEGGNVFTQGVNSGDPVIGEPGQAARALIRSGFLEESNVELAEQFTDLITAQRAFQANTRTISTANQLLQDLINLV